MKEKILTAAKQVADIGCNGDYQEQVVGHAFAMFASILSDMDLPDRPLLANVVRSLDAHGEHELADKVRRSL